MLGKRSTDPVPPTRFRSDRISSVNGQYFSTREATLEGPYFTRFDAERKSTRISAGCANRRKSRRRVLTERYRRGIYFPAAETFKKGSETLHRMNALTSG